jgi:putative nucleotidyltransferase-like protein
MHLDLAESSPPGNFVAERPTSAVTEQHQERGPLQPPRLDKLGIFEREPISETTRRLLCDFAAGDPTRALQRADVDWDEVFEAVCRNGLVGLTFAYLKQHPAEEYPPADFKRRITWAHVLASAYLTRTRQSVKSILLRFAEAGLECLVLKGPVLAEMIYPDPNSRWYGDLDIHVRERDLPAAHQLLREGGLILDEHDCPSPPRLVPQAPGDEWNYWTADRWFKVELHGDDLLHGGLVPRDYDGLWQRSVTVEVQGVRVKALSLEDQLITLAAHVHYHGYTRLNWLSDIAFIVRDHGDEVNWERLIQTVRTEEVQVPVYYTLYFLDRLLGVPAPDWVMQRIRPDAFRRRVHEHFLPTDKVVSLDPMPRPDFSFYFLPLFQRLVPDLLVMGRRKEKLQYLARLAVPSSAWLRHYYGLSEADPIAQHYVLHPLKLGWHYLVSIASALSWRWQQRAGSDEAVASTWWAAHARTPGWQQAHH